jgi:hypothetical protein
LPQPPLELTLPHLQRWMQAVIVHAGTVDEAVEAPAARAEIAPEDVSRVILPSKTLTPVERVGVYQGMYLLRMIEALEGDYPAVAHLLGSDAFADLVTRYVELHPSVSYTFNRLGGGLPEFIRQSKGLRGRWAAAELARLERAVTEVFDAPESPSWPAEGIEAMAEEDWVTAVLEPIAAFRVAEFNYPVNAYLQSVKDENHDHPPLRREPSYVAIYRKSYEVWRLDLSKPAYGFLRSLAKGRPFARAVAEAAKNLQGSPGDQLFRWLRDWVAEGMFTGVKVPA